MNIFKRNLSITRPELEAYIGENAYTPFYTKSLDRYMMDPNSINWNWPSFFISMYWLLFRKTVVPAIGLVILNILIINFLPLFIAPIVSLIVLVFLGVYGTNLYFFFAEKKIAQIKEQNNFLSESEVLAAIQLQGGSSWAYPLGLYLVQFVIYNFI